VVVVVVDEAVAVVTVEVAMVDDMVCVPVVVDELVVTEDDAVEVDDSVALLLVFVMVPVMVLVVEVAKLSFKLRTTPPSSFWLPLYGAIINATAPSGIVTSFRSYL